MSNEDKTDSTFVEIKNASLRYGGGSTGLLAVENVDMQIEEGQFVAIVGPSGCGKSSLLKLISGLHPAYDGSIKINGNPVTRPTGICGLAFQNATMLPWRTTLENVMLPLEIIKNKSKSSRQQKKENEQRARALLAAVNLKDFEQRYPWELSGGMLQRASLCRTLIHKPRLLLLDEPFGALDAFTREELWKILQDLFIDERPTVVLVTHDLREAVFLSDTIYVFSPCPGHVISRTDVDFPRPRTVESTYTTEVTDLVRDLHEQIQHS